MGGRTRWAALTTLFALAGPTAVARATTPVYAATATSAIGLDVSEPAGAQAARFAVARLSATPREPRSGFDATIDWGDGARSRGIVSRVVAGTRLVLGLHVYVVPGTFRITTRVTVPGASQFTVSSTARVTASFHGASGAPLDSSSAIGPSRFVEVINGDFATFDRNGSLLSDGSPNGIDVGDPSVLWDPASQRFYYSELDPSAPFGFHPGISWGFSRTSTPTSPADWCSYYEDFDYSATGTYADYPRLGTTRDYLLIAVGRIQQGMGHAGISVSGDVAWISKPRVRGTCPTQQRFRSGIFENLKTARGQTAYSPVAVRQTDPSDEGTVLASAGLDQRLAGDALTVFRVSPTGAGRLGISAPKSLPVSPFQFPNAARQAGTAEQVETNDGRLTQAWSGIDPRLGHEVVWTAHTVLGGAGAEVRWYEIDPSLPRIDQQGVLTDPNRFFFNATVAPDRAVSGGSGRFGSDMVLEFDTSSSTSDVGVAMLTKRGAAAPSPLTFVHSSLVPYTGSYADAPGCENFPRWDLFHVASCYWGDYSGSSPDPTPPTDAPSGEVWSTNQWTSSHWDTWNWAALP